MFFDPFPLLIALAVLTIGPLLIGGILRLLGLRRAARVAAALTLVLCVAFGTLLYMPGGQGWLFVVVQALLALGLWGLSAPERGNERGATPTDDRPPA